MSSVNDLPWRKKNEEETSQLYTDKKKKATAPSEKHLFFLSAQTNALLCLPQRRWETRGSCELEVPLRATEHLAAFGRRRH